MWGKFETFLTLRVSYETDFSVRRKYEICKIEKFWVVLSETPLKIPSRLQLGKLLRTQNSFITTLSIHNELYKTCKQAFIKFKTHKSSQ